MSTQGLELWFPPTQCLFQDESCAATYWSLSLHACPLKITDIGTWSTHPPRWVGWAQDKAGPLGVLLSLDVLISS